VKAIGLMSGTSLDGVDAALVEIHPRGTRYGIELLAFETTPYDPPLRAALFDALPPNRGSVAAVARLEGDLGDAYGRAARKLAKAQRVAFVASHGQTIWHDGETGVTLQLGDPFRIRETAGATVCYDFRRADCAAGGQGAPLVAWVDAVLLASDDEDRVALNLGGIANVTLLRRSASPREAVAFDTGPGNMLLDALVRARTGGSREFDDNGELAARGRIDEPLLGNFLGDPYFRAAPPKTTGRERFGAHFLARHEEALARLSLEDAAATLTELTAVSIARALAAAHFAPGRVIVSGGGARNATLLARLHERLGNARVERSDTMGLPADAKEAMAFAVLGYETLRGRTANVPAATGASHPAVLGAIAPHELRVLLDEIARECGESQ
jgi:anhydro-N-acetylmuramic acid kinase